MPRPLPWVHQAAHFTLSIRELCPEINSFALEVHGDCILAVGPTGAERIGRRPILTANDQGLGVVE